MSKWRVDFLNGDKSSGYMIVQASSERLAAKQAKEKDFFVCHVHEVSEDTKIASYINDQEITTNSELASSIKLCVDNAQYC